jgi:benzodiazapine receptor
VIATALASVVSLTRGDIAYMLVIAWAFAGIGVKQAATPIVATTAWIMMAVVLVMTVVGAWFHHQRTQAGG